MLVKLNKDGESKIGKLYRDILLNGVFEVIQDNYDGANGVLVRTEERVGQIIMNGHYDIVEE